MPIDLAKFAESILFTPYDPKYRQPILCKVVCGYCNGSGRVNDGLCVQCSGNGYVLVEDES